MPSVYAMVFPTDALAKVCFCFDEAGVLVQLSLCSAKALGCHGVRPALAPSQRAVGEWLQEYLEGKAGDFPGAWVLPGTTPFSRAVYGLVAKLPRGKTLSYGEVAAAVGSPGASRAVGNAMGRNPLPLVVP